MKYPFILLYRDDENSEIDGFFSENNALLQCTVHVINKTEKLNSKLIIIFFSLNLS